MGHLPPKKQKRRVALEEFLKHRDMTILRSQVDGSYAYEEAWPLIQEHFGSADFVLFLDYRAFVNVQVMLQMLDELPSTRLIQGVILDETSFGSADPRRNFLWRRRAGAFPHGMGFLMSRDVATFLSEMAKKFPLRQAETPADVALGFWLQLLEDLQVFHSPERFHELPVRHNVLSVDGSVELRQQVTTLTAVAWPMGPSGWRHFDDRTCQLGPKNASSPMPKTSKVPGKELECWDGLNGGRPEAWYLACCNMGFANCWSDDYTPERCCPWPPQTPAPDPPLGLDVLQEFLNFSENEVQLFLAALVKDSTSGHETSPGGTSGRLLCLAPKDCAKEAFARLFFGFWHQKLLPLRHPWLVNHEEDQLSGVNLILRSTNQGQYPQGQEHIVERVQVAHFLSKVQRHLDDPSFRWPSQPRRCLEWDSGGYSRHFFRDFCQVIDVLTYHGEGVASMRDNGPAANGKIDYFVDIHLADQVIPENSTAMVICAQVFEHLSQPFVAMKQIYRLLAPGGLLAWTVPLFSEIHGAPQDFWRFTPGGANRLALYAGLEVVQIYAPGGLRETTGSLLGMTKPYWREEEILEDRHDPWPLQVYMLARKPM